jgi:hypothetical protein
MLIELGPEASAGHTKADAAIDNIRTSVFMITPNRDANSSQILFEAAFIRLDISIQLERECIRQPLLPPSRKAFLAHPFVLARMNKREAVRIAGENPAMFRGAIRRHAEERDIARRHVAFVDLAQMAGQRRI